MYEEFGINCKKYNDEKIQNFMVVMFPVREVGSDRMSNIAWTYEGFSFWG